MVETKHLSLDELEAGLPEIMKAPREQGVLERIVRRPNVGAREIVEEGELDLREGLVGDNWKSRGSSRTPDGAAHPDMQLNVMNSRVIALVAQSKNRWHLAGDQLIVDFDLSAANLPPGQQMAIGSAVIEVTDQPHAGCQKFVARFGLAALKFVNSRVGKELRLRGINTRVIQPGTIRVGDIVTKVGALY